MKVSEIIVLGISAAMIAAAWMMFQSDANEHRERHGTVIIEDVSDEN
jgi:type II secretory pathway pseudopilin PulG